MGKLAPIAKAVVAGLVAGLGALGTALIAGEHLSQVDAKTWLSVVLTGLLGTGLVYTVPNKPPS